MAWRTFSPGQVYALSAAGATCTHTYAHTQTHTHTDRHTHTCTLSRLMHSNLRITARQSTCWHVQTCARTCELTERTNTHLDGDPFCVMRRGCTEAVPVWILYQRDLLHGLDDIGALLLVSRANNKEALECICLFPCAYTRMHLHTQTHTYTTTHTIHTIQNTPHPTPPIRHTYRGLSSRFTLPIPLHRAERLTARVCQRWTQSCRLKLQW